MNYINNSSDDCPLRAKWFIYFFLVPTPTTLTALQGAHVPDCTQHFISVISFNPHNSPGKGQNENPKPGLPNTNTDNQSNTHHAALVISWEPGARA